jgi:hypothetical protein
VRERKRYRLTNRTDKADSHPKNKSERPRQHSESELYSIDLDTETVKLFRWRVQFEERLGEGLLHPSELPGLCVREVDQLVRILASVAQPRLGRSGFVVHRSSAVLVLAKVVIVELRIAVAVPVERFVPSVGALLQFVQAESVSLNNMVPHRFDIKQGAGTFDHFGRGKTGKVLFEWD